MKDMLGVTVELGDIIVAAAATQRGEAKLGKVYAFDKNGWPMVKFVGQKYNSKTGEYEKAWRKAAAGSHVLVLGRPDWVDGTPFATLELLRRIGMDYEGDIPSYVG